MKLVLLLALLAGPTIYEWVDAKGGTHFTDDPSTIPAGAKRRVTEGAEVMISPAAPRPDAGVARPTLDAGVVRATLPTPEVGPDTCTAARKQISQLERQLQEAKGAFEETQEREAAACRQRLMTHGDATFAACMAGRSSEPDQAPTAAVQNQLEAARETLRRAQVSGCR